MNSLEWRIKQLEDRVSGQCTGHATIYNQLNDVAKAYLDHTSQSEEYNIFESKYKGAQSTPTLDTTKIELVLDHQADLKNHLESSKAMADKAEKVLSIENWPDLSSYQDRIKSLQTSIAKYDKEASQIDKKTEEYIQLFYDLKQSMKSNMINWNERLELFAQKDNKSDEDLEETS